MVYNRAWGVGTVRCIKDSDMQLVSTSLSSASVLLYERYGYGYLFADTVNMFSSLKKIKWIIIDFLDLNLSIPERFRILVTSIVVTNS